MMGKSSHCAHLILFLGIILNFNLTFVNAFQRGPRSGSWIETISWRPRAFVWHGFLSDDEADHIIKISTPRLQRSSVINSDGTTTAEHEIRTSWGTFLSPGEDDVIRNIDLRVAKWTRLPPSHSESMQILRYEFNQSYLGHWDEQDPSEGNTVGGTSPRMASILMYLSDVQVGGETAFPHGHWIDKEAQTQGKTFSDCTEGGPAVHPRKGDALMFYGLKADVSRLEYFSFHAGCPVLYGTKWTAVKWIHTRPYTDEEGDIEPEFV